MSDVLSQSEIDALLSAMSGGEYNEIEEEQPEDTHNVKKYDFKRPNKFSKEHIKTLERVHENFARLVSNYLSTHLRTSVQMKVVSVEQITFDEFIRSIPNPTILITFLLQPFTDVMILETGQQFDLQLIDILFGGSGKSTIKTREFTDIEKNIIKRIDLKMLEELKPSWEDVMDVDAKFVSMETNPALCQVLSPNESVALVSISVNIADNESLINMCIPYISIEKFVDKLVKQYRNVSSVNDNEGNKVALSEKLNDVNLDLSVLLGKTTITVEEFTNLNIGDCLILDKKTTEPLDAYIGKDKYFKVSPGTIGRKRGAQIVQINDKDVENDER